MQWGYNTPFKLLINARGEDIENKKTFSNMINYNRCVILASGYYEWLTFL